MLTIQLPHVVEALLRALGQFANSAGLCLVMEVDCRGQD